MFGKCDILNELQLLRAKDVEESEKLLSDVKNILIESKFNERNILNHLKDYNKSFLLIDEPDVDKDSVYTLKEIESIATKYRLRFLDSQHFKGEYPYEVILKIKDLNREHRKDLAYFKILADEEFFKSNKFEGQVLIFAETLYGNYFHFHTWGNPFPKTRIVKKYPLQKLETMFVSLCLLSLVLTLILPTKLITFDERADYWSMYRIAAYFHILIFCCGFAVFFLFSFRKNFSQANWDDPKISK